MMTMVIAVIMKLLSGTLTIKNKRPKTQNKRRAYVDSWAFHEDPRLAHERR